MKEYANHGFLFPTSTLLAELLRRGYSESDLRKICSENVLRVWRANE